MSDVSYQHPEYKNAQDAWLTLNDVCSAGDKAIKDAGVRYLPIPNPDDNSTANQKRYEQYKKRAVFYNVTGRTLRGMVGMVFSKWPNPSLPNTLSFLLSDIDGAGTSIYQQSQRVVNETLKLGRHALFVDYPATDGVTSVAEKQQKYIRARIVSIDAQQVINWRSSSVGGITKLSLVVIKENVTKQGDNPYELKSETQYRVLSLNEGVYQVQIFTDDSLDTPISTHIPTDGTGKPWREIPFTFVGSTNNDSVVDEPPLLDMATLNLAHYRNSADYEDSAFFVGQAQPWISGLTEEWRDWMQEQGIYIGSRTPISLPQNGAFGFAQALPNTLVKEAMDTKETQMIALGARVIERGSAIKTATQVDSEDSISHSVLSLVANNVSDAYTLALNWCAQYENVQGSNIEFTLNQEYIDQQLDPQQITALVTAWQQGVLPKSQLWRNFKRADVIDPELSDDEIQGEIEEEIPSLGLHDE